MTEIKCEVSQHQSYCCVLWGDDKVHKHIHQIDCSRSLDVTWSHYLMIVTPCILPVSVVREACSRSHGPVGFVRT